VIDRANQAVHITLPYGVTRTAKYLGSQGCVTLPVGETTVKFKPVAVKTGLPDPATQRWPMGDVLADEPLPREIDARLAVEKRGEDYLSFPQRALFDKIGVRTMVIETDPFGNFLGQGYDLESGRDWARLGNPYLHDGVWNDERILPEGYVKFASTPAPAWKADGRPIYGAFFWINGDGTFPVPKDAYYMAGAGGQTTLIIPSHDLIVVRMGHYKGAAPGAASFSKALALLMQAIPKSD
jgi:CubicO group peptidase (beta-lactamase class C family)